MSSPVLFLWVGLKKFFFWRLGIIEAGLECLILLPHPPQYWDHGHVPPDLAPIFQSINGYLWPVGKLFTFSVK
jgi:hypothetical protein